MTPEQIALDSESSHQKALMCWARTIGVHQYSELRWLFSIPNGGFRTKSGAANLKAEGVKKGVPDVCLPVPRGIYHALYIEMKKPKSAAGKRAGFTTKDQSEWIDYLRSQNYGAIVCRGWEEARDTLIQYLEWK